MFKFPCQSILFVAVLIFFVSRAEAFTSFKPLKHTCHTYAAGRATCKQLGRTPHSKALFSVELPQENLEISSPESPAPMQLVEVDVLYKSRKPLVYDPKLERYVPEDGHEAILQRNGDSSYSRLTRLSSGISASVGRALLPEGVNTSYYRYMRWRFLQRFINSNVHVFGTQSLLLGLGLKSKLGLAAALNWVLKDALGKIVRMAWASKMGRKFDSDAKRWRFRSSIVYAMGNGLEIVTYVFPGLFLLFATLANCFKQVSMLTSSSTRTALYNSFRDGTRENIGDITAKGEAQIAIVDLLGIASGVTLSRAVGMRVSSVFAVYVILQTIEIACMYKEISAVEFQVLNFERLVQLVNAFVSYPRHQYQNATLPTPQEMAKSEKIFLPPKHLERRAIAFGSLGRAKLAPDELQKLMEIFRNERFLLVIGEDIKNRRRGRWGISRHPPDVEEKCHIVLHAEANNVDITKSVLALSLLRKSLREHSPSSPARSLRSRDCLDIIFHAHEEADRCFPTLLKTMSKFGWASPARFMFGRVTMRAEWDLMPRSLAGKNSSSAGASRRDAKET